MKPIPEDRHTEIFDKTFDCIRRINDGWGNEVRAASRIVRLADGKLVVVKVTVETK